VGHRASENGGLSHELLRGEVCRDGGEGAGEGEMMGDEAVSGKERGAKDLENEDAKRLSVEGWREAGCES